MKRVTVKDIALRSGCSVSTVSKTLNGTDRVGAETIEKIKRIAEEMGYRSSLSAQSLVRKPRRVAIVIFRHPPEVRRLFEEGFSASFDLYSEFGIEPVYYLFDRMEEINWNRIREESDAVIVTPGVDFAGCAALIDEIGRSMPLALLQSQPTESISSCLCEVTVNARVVGAVAAQLLNTGEPDVQTAVLTGYSDTWIHSENIRGFTDATSGYGLQRPIIAECRDDMELAAEVTRQLLTEHPGLKGIFVTSYVSPAVCHAAAQMGRQIRVVGVDLFGDSAACLRSGALHAAIFQNQQKQAQMALEAVVNSFRGITAPPRLTVKPEIVLNSNLSCYGWL